MLKYRMPIKRMQSSFWMIGTLILLVVILLMTLVYLQTGDKSVKSERQQPSMIQQQPQVIVIDKTEKDRLPVYPTNLPKYSSPEYQQVGILTSNETDKEPIVLPLYGRKLYNRSDRWQYYTATDKNNMIRLPLNYENRDCEDDVGCKELYSGDKLSVDIYQGRSFTATIYRTDSPRYFAESY